jgi:hypothetical protein
VHAVAREPDLDVAPDRQATQKRRKKQDSAQREAETRAAGPARGVDARASTRRALKVETEPNPQKLARMSSNQSLREHTKRLLAPCKVVRPLDVHAVRPAQLLGRLHADVALELHRKRLGRKRGVGQCRIVRDTHAVAAGHASSNTGATEGKRAAGSHA